MNTQNPLIRLLMLILICISLQNCNTEEPIDSPPVENNPRELSFEQSIKGVWKGQGYYIEYFDANGELLFTDRLNVFINKINLDGENITYDYKNSSPDWTNEYTTRTENDKNYIVFLGFPEIHVVELSGTLMIWEETSNGGVYDDNSIVIQADHQTRTFIFNK